MYHIGLTAEWKSGKPMIMEPDKVSEEWKWYALDKLPKPLFELCRLSFDAFKIGKKYYKSEKEQKNGKK